MRNLLRRRRLQRLRRSLIGKTFVEIKNGIGITHQVLWVGQSRFGEKHIRIGLKSSNRTAMRWIPHNAFTTNSQRSLYGFECRRRNQASGLERPERRKTHHPLEATPLAPSVAESTEASAGA